MPDPFSSPDETIVNRKIPVFAPKKIVSATADILWTPAAGDVAFFASEFTTFTIGAGSTYVNLEPGQVIGIQPGTTFTFSTTVALAVM